MYQIHHNCLLCDSSALIELPKFSGDYLVQCSKCSFVFCKRIPTEEELVNYYKDYPSDHLLSPITVKRYHELLDTFEHYKKTNKILDIGCGDGYFLREAKNRGWQVYGTEFSDHAYEIGKKKGITMHKGILNPENYSFRDFDVITSFEVIEHINNPKEEVENINKLLRTGGLFYFTTPNFNSISRLISKLPWNVILYPEHLSYYTAGSMNRFLTKKGFEKIKIETTGISFSRLQATNNPKKQHSAQKKKLTDEEIRQKTETKFVFKLIKSCANFTLNLFKMGDSLKGYYQKK